MRKKGDGGVNLDKLVLCEYGVRSVASIFRRYRLEAKTSGKWTYNSPGLRFDMTGSDFSTLVVTLGSRDVIEASATSLVAAVLRSVSGQAWHSSFLFPLDFSCRNLKPSKETAQYQLICDAPQLTRSLWLSLRQVFDNVRFTW